MPSEGFFPLFSTFDYYYSSFLTFIKFSYVADALPRVATYAGLPLVLAFFGVFISTSWLAMADMAKVVFVCALGFEADVMRVTAAVAL